MILKKTNNFNAKKHILFLGDKDSPLLKWLKNRGELVIQTEKTISPETIDVEKIGFLISYGYRHIIRKEILDLFPSRVINLHISYLPWNRGADPNLWSIVDSTPKGVTIHYVDEGLDTGDIIVQKRVCFDLEKETLATSYAKLQSSIQELFRENWSSIKNISCPRIKQIGAGSYHKKCDKEELPYSLIEDWSIPLSELEKKS